MKRRRSKKRVPLGQPINDDIQFAALVTPDDVEEALAWARRYGSERLADMLNADRDPNVEAKPVS